MLIFLTNEYKNLYFKNKKLFSNLYVLSKNKFQLLLLQSNY